MDLENPLPTSLAATMLTNATTNGAVDDSLSQEPATSPPTSHLLKINLLPDSVNDGAYMSKDTSLLSASSGLTPATEETDIAELSQAVPVNSGSLGMVCDVHPTTQVQYQWLDTSQGMLLTNRLPVA
jgi:hypothetical protein